MILAFWRILPYAFEISILSCSSSLASCSLSCALKLVWLHPAAESSYASSRKALSLMAFLLEKAF